MPSSLRDARLPAVLAVIVLLTTACGETDTGEAAEDPAGVLQQFVDNAAETLREFLGEADEQIGDASAGGEPGVDQGAEPGDPGAGGTAADGGGSGSGSEPATSSLDDQAPLGAGCRPYLRGDVPGMVVEVAHQEGAAPRSAAVDHLVGTLRGVVDKPSGVQLAGPATVPGGGRTWTADELRAFASQHRTHWSSAEQAAMYVLAVRGQFEEEGVLGVAISATEMVVFPDDISGLGTELLGGRQAVERAVLVHEAGHLLCLVNIGYDSARDHEDPDHPHHSVHEDSVMHWAIETDAITQVFSGPPPADFHPDDVADLEGLRQGRH